MRRFEPCRQRLFADRASRFIWASLQQIGALLTLKATNEHLNRNAQGKDNVLSCKPALGVGGLPRSDALDIQLGGLRQWRPRCHRQLHNMRQPLHAGPLAAAHSSSSSSQQPVVKQVLVHNTAPPPHVEPLPSQQRPAPPSVRSPSLQRSLPAALAPDTQLAVTPAPTHGTTMRTSIWHAPRLP